MPPETTPPAAPAASAQDIVRNADPAALEAAAAALLGGESAPDTTPVNQTPPTPAAPTGATPTPPAPAGTQPPATNEGKPSEEGKEQGKTPEGENQGKPKTGIERLLEQRNAARKEASDKEAEIARLTAELEAAKSGKAPDATPPAAPQTPPAPKPEDLNKPVTHADLLRMQAEANQQAKDAKFLTDFPAAKDHLANAEKVMQVHPTLTLEHAVMLVAPEIFAGNAAPASPDVNAGTRTPAPLRDANIDPANMTQEQRKAHLEAALQRGELDDL